MARARSLKPRSTNRFYRRIESAYIYANRKLLTLMLKEQELLLCLRWAYRSQAIGLH